MDIQIRNLRKAHGLTQTELGNAIGASKRQIGYWESGKLSLDDAVKVADYFRCSLDELVGRWEYVGSYSDDRQRQMNEAYNYLEDGEKDSALGAVLGVASVSARKKAGIEGPEANEGVA